MRTRHTKSDSRTNRVGIPCFVDACRRLDSRPAEALREFAAAIHICRCTLRMMCFNRPKPRSRRQAATLNPKEWEELLSAALAASWARYNNDTGLTSTRFRSHALPPARLRLLHPLRSSECPFSPLNAFQHRSCRSPRCSVAVACLQTSRL